MKFYPLCIECYNQDDSRRVLAVGEVTSDLIAVCTCPKGHVIIAGLMHDLFDVLYTSAVDSFLKECYSESVLSFAASLERTYEMFIKTTLLADKVCLASIDNYWKEVTKQSERQYGSFCSQYLKVTGKPWRVNTDFVGFRNKVIHQGYVATREDVSDYAEYITSCQSDLIKIMKSSFFKEKQIIYFHQKKEAQQAAQKLITKHGAKFVASSDISLLRWNEMGSFDLTFSDSIIRLKSAKRTRQ